LTWKETPKTARPLKCGRVFFGRLRPFEGNYFLFAFLLSRENLYQLFQVINRDILVVINRKAFYIACFIVNNVVFTVDKVSFFPHDLAPYHYYSISFLFRKWLFWLINREKTQKTARQLAGRL
jgi:hypothetical protein